MYRKEPASPGRRPTRKNDTLSRPGAICTAPPLYRTTKTQVFSLSNTGMSNISFSSKSCWCWLASGTLLIAPLLSLRPLFWLRALTNFPTLCPSREPFVYIGLKVGVNYSCTKSSPAECNTGPVEGKRAGWEVRRGTQGATGWILNGAAAVSNGACQSLA